LTDGTFRLVGEKKPPTFCRMIGIEHTDYPEVPTSIF